MDRLEIRNESISGISHPPVAKPDSLFALPAGLGQVPLAGVASIAPISALCLLLAAMFLLFLCLSILFRKAHYPELESSSMQRDFI